MSSRRVWMYLWSGIVLLLAFGGMANALRCYTCGMYPRDGTGSVTPCTHADEKTSMTCPPFDHYCVKYVNKNMIVRQCAQTCHEKISGEEGEYCCVTDNCNGSKGLGGAVGIVILSATCAAAYQRLRY